MTNGECREDGGVPRPSRPLSLSVYGHLRRVWIVTLGQGMALEGDGVVGARGSSVVKTVGDCND